MGLKNQSRVKIRHNDRMEKRDGVLIFPWRKRIMATNLQIWLRKLTNVDVSKVMTKIIAIKYITFKQMIRIKWER